MNNTVIHMPSGGSPVLPQGRLIFAIDATASRADTWSIARDLQAKMFRETAPIGALSAQLVFYRGDECKASKWASSGEQLAQLMNKIECVGGMTQISRILQHALREHAKAPVQALTFIGDASEEEADTLISLAGELGAVGLPIHVFQEGRDNKVRKLFRMLALKSGGSYHEFNPDTAGAVERLSAQLNEVARFAVTEAMAITHKKGE